MHIADIKTQTETCWFCLRYDVPNPRPATRIVVQDFDPAYVCESHLDAAVMEASRNPERRLTVTTR